MSRSETALDPTDLILPEWSPYRPDRALDWMEGWSVTTGEPCWIPANAVAHPYTGSAEQLMILRGITNGLASGNEIEEGICHALAEVIERDAWSLCWVRVRFGLGADVPGIDPATGPADVAWLQQRFRQGGVQAFVRDITSELGVPAYYAATLEHTGTRMLSHEGMGAHPDPSVALARALTEAAQSRAADIQGSREDLDYWRRRAGTWDGTSDVWGLRRAATMRPVDMSEGARHADIREDIRWMVARLAAAGLTRVYVVDLTDPAIGVPVVRVVVPGLEFTAIDKVPRRCTHPPGRGRGEGTGDRVMRTVNIVFKSLYSCTHKCSFCHVLAAPRSVSYMSTADVKGTFDEIEHLFAGGRVELEMSGGEFTLRKDAIELVQYLRTKRIRWSSLVLDTMAVPLADEALCRALGALFDKAHVSVHAPDADRHAKISQSSTSFERLQTALANVFRYFPAVFTNTSICAHNYDQLEAIAEMILTARRASPATPLFCLFYLPVYRKYGEAVAENAWRIHAESNVDLLPDGALLPRNPCRVRAHARTAGRARRHGGAARFQRAGVCLPGSGRRIPGERLRSRQLHDGLLLHRLRAPAHGAAHARGRVSVDVGWRQAGRVRTVHGQCGVSGNP